MSDLAIAADRWRDNPEHRRWLRRQAEALLGFYERRLIDVAGGFFNLDDVGQPLTGDAERPLHVTTRMVHCFAIAHLMGRPGAADIIDHGVKALRQHHRDAKHGGYFWSFDAAGPRERDKLAYGHGFVMLAAASAKCAGHPDAVALLADISEVIDKRFWEAGPGASAEEFREDWSSFSSYRGQNANMHLTEALMAAFETTNERGYLTKAESIAALLLREKAAGENWRVPEHFDAQWKIDRDYSGSDMFRPASTTPGHSLEWARLALQLWELGERRLAWLPPAARALFLEATSSGWDRATGGFYYTLDWRRRPAIRDRLWWPCCEAIGAAAFLQGLDGDAASEAWYRRFWNFTARHFIDPQNGGWRPQLGDDLAPKAGYFLGKPDLYHALQACLIPLYPTTGSLTKALRSSPIR